MKQYIFVDCEATGPCPGIGVMTEFGAVDYATRSTFHGVLYESEPDPENPAKSRLKLDGPCACLTCSYYCGCNLPGHHDGEASTIDRPKVWAYFEAWLNNLGPGRRVFVSDNPAYDWQWINHGFWHYRGHNPFGHSARRISDFYAGVKGDWEQTQAWKEWRITPHDHNPVHDSLGNVEAFDRIMEMAKEAREYKKINS
jgi:hypothetical protein